MLAGSKHSIQGWQDTIITEYRAMRLNGEISFQHGVGGGATGKVQVSATASRLAYPGRPPLVNRLNLQR